MAEANDMVEQQNKTKFGDLNYDCIEKFFNWLPSNDLASFGQINSRFQPIARQVFAIRNERRKEGLVCIERPERQKPYHITGEKKFERCFYWMIPNVYVSFKRNSNSTDFQSAFQVIRSSCADNLHSLYLDGYLDSESGSDWEASIPSEAIIADQLKSLKNLYISYSKIGDILTYCSDIETLFIHDAKDTNISWMRQIFKNLKKFYFIDSGYHRIGEFLQNHQHLEFIRVNYKNVVGFNIWNTRFAHLALYIRIHQIIEIVAWSRFIDSLELIINVWDPETNNDRALQHISTMNTVKSLHFPLIGSFLEVNGHINKNITRLCLSHLESLAATKIEGISIAFPNLRELRLSFDPNVDNIGSLLVSIAQQFHFLEHVYVILYEWPNLIDVNILNDMRTGLNNASPVTIHLSVQFHSDFGHFENIYYDFVKIEFHGYSEIDCHLCEPVGRLDNLRILRKIENF